MPQFPLSGLTVISLEQAVAAPFCSRQLAEQGARVIKIERPGVGDFARGYDQTVQGQSAYFLWLNRSKESLSLDVKQPDALKVLKQLIAKADVFIQNLAPGAASVPSRSLFRPIATVASSRVPSHTSAWVRSRAPAGAAPWRGCAAR